MIFFWLTLRQYMSERGNANVRPDEGLWVLHHLSTNERKEKSHRFVIAVELSTMGNNERREGTIVGFGAVSGC